MRQVKLHTSYHRNAIELNARFDPMVTEVVPPPASPRPEPRAQMRRPSLFGGIVPQDAPLRLPTVLLDHSKLDAYTLVTPPPAATAATGPRWQSTLRRALSRSTSRASCVSSRVIASTTDRSAKSRRSASTIARGPSALSGAV